MLRIKKKIELLKKPARGSLCIRDWQSQKDAANEEDETATPA